MAFSIPPKFSLPALYSKECDYAGVEGMRHPMPQPSHSGYGSSSSTKPLCRISNDLPLFEHLSVTEVDPITICQRKYQPKNPSSSSDPTTGGFRPYDEVIFDPAGERRGTGVPMVDLLDRTLRRCPLRDPHAEMFLSTTMPHLTFRILWPAYPTHQFAESIQLHLTDGDNRQRRLTRLQLACMIADCFRRYFDQCRQEQPQVTHEAPARDYNFGMNGLQFEDLRLVSVYYVAEDTWQAQVRFYPPI